MPSTLAELDVVTLSRVQFALTIMFHYLFPPLTIGLGVVLVWLGFQFVRTGDPLYRQAQKFWTRIFALNFAIGVATGIVMEFEFGTNWAVYSEFVGDVFGSALAAEGIFAFFLESGFLAVLVFGWDRVEPADAFLQHLHGGTREHLLGRLDHGRQLLAADPGRAPYCSSFPQRCSRGSSTAIPCFEPRSSTSGPWCSTRPASFG